MPEPKNEKVSQTQVRIGRTVYCVTCHFSGEKDLDKTLEHLALKKAAQEVSA